MSLEEFTNSIDIRVETIWQGKVGVRDKYVDQAIREFKGLHISHGNETMKIPPEKVKSMILFKSKTPLFDKFSKAEHFLYYYFWAFNPRRAVVTPKAPEVEQLQLFK